MRVISCLLAVLALTACLTPRPASLAPYQGLWLIEDSIPGAACHVRGGFVILVIERDIVSLAIGSFQHDGVGGSYRIASGDKDIVVLKSTDPRHQGFFRLQLESAQRIRMDLVTDGNGVQKSLALSRCPDRPEDADR